MKLERCNANNIQKECKRNRKQHDLATEEYCFHTQWEITFIFL